MRKTFLFLLSCFFLIHSFAQSPSPEKFLGYKIGDHFTPHWKIVDYFKSVVAANPSTMKWQQYGQTNEGRPLFVVFISTPSNIANLEAIRTNNLRLAGLGDRSTANTSGVPAIVWLSYNVHGNEASSSEASMLTLYALADGGNAQTKPWLDHVVVAIDPCINPDGRDRYVNWFNTMAGKNYNASPDAREHREPWPGGRSNHYNFDLNRDWAWQTQVETKQRLALYSTWLPQVHVDFHEQGINAPYYFAPAAQPYHEVITPWQRDFQVTIGKNHARYFDEKGWLYFTKEEFDLFYPSYGDTYPIYNGAIGMTYEQGGGPAGGLGIINQYGDTLTLTDRAMHHYTTSLSTIEVASGNTQRLISEFQKFFKDGASNSIGTYKSYVIKYNPEDGERIQSLLSLLQRNGIAYGSATSTSFRGYNYFTGKEENASSAAHDIVISAYQPKSALVKVLFEPKTNLVDSLTYDISAWSLPYVYGLKTFATTQKLETSPYTAPSAMPSRSATEAYGYVMRWNGIQSVKMATRLLQKGIRLRYNESPFTIGGQSFERGAVLILRTSNQQVPDLWNTVQAAAAETGVNITAVPSGFVDKGYDFGSTKVHPLRRKRVALLTGEGVNSNAAGEVWFFFEQLLDYPITLINAADAGRMNWGNYDVVIMPDGNYRFLSDKTQSDQFHNWINGGGSVVALEGAVAQLAHADWSVKAKKQDETTDNKDTYAPLKKYESRVRDEISNTTPGSIFRVELDNSHPLAFGYPPYYYTLKQDDAIYDFIKEGGWNVGIVKKEKQVSGFVGNKLQNRLQDGLLFGVQNIGRGTVTYLADDVLFRSFWENGKLMFANAVFLVGQ